MVRVELEDVKAWAEKTKLNIAELDGRLLDQIESQVLTRLDAGFDVSTWLSPSTTPTVVKSAISMFYLAWVYDRQYSEEQRTLNEYAILLRANAESLMIGLLDGSIVIPNTPSTSSSPAFYPTDASSLVTPSADDWSTGDAKFSMGRVF